MKLGLLFPVAMLASSLFASGCAVDASDDGSGSEDGDSIVDDSAALSSGVNGSACLQSPYNCKLRAAGGNRIDTAAGDEEWSVGSGYVLDGNGDPMTLQTPSMLKFNYGQARVMNGKLHLLAMSTANGSSGWFPLDAIAGKASIDAKVGRVKAEDPGGGSMACYEVTDRDIDDDYAAKKVVYDADGSHERVGDYMPLLRKNGAKYANLAFNVPGVALGGPAIDIFPVGTKFQRVQVPTVSGKPHLAVKLYVKGSSGHYTKRSGTLDFYYGYVKLEGGAKRFGWMAAPALEASSGCK